MEGKELEARLGKLLMALEETRKRHAELKEEMSRLEKQEILLLGQISERKEDKVVSPVLPQFKDQKELQEALDNRGKDVLGRSPEETGKFRQELMEGEGKGTVEFVDQVQKGQ